MQFTGLLVHILTTFTKQATHYTIKAGEEKSKPYQHVFENDGEEEQKDDPHDEVEDMVRNGDVV